MNDTSVSIITVTLNSSKTIRDTINSLLNQNYKNVEFIIIDGGSTDGTIELIRSFGKKVSIFKSEPDKGIYDAINKGIKYATGEIIGTLNSDDVFYDDKVIEKVVRTFDDPEIDAVYGDIVFVSPNAPNKTIRYYSSKHFNPGRFRYGFMPAHPSFYVRRELFDNFGYYRTDFKIAADFELLVRFINVNRIKCKFIEMPFVRMRTGGVSTKSWKSNYLLNSEILRACRENGIKTNYLKIYSKYLLKIFEFF